MKDHRWWRSAIARRVYLVGACAFMLLAMLTTRAGVADSFTGQFAWAGHWITTVLLGVGAFALGFFYFGSREQEADE